MQARIHRHLRKKCSSLEEGEGISCSTIYLSKQVAESFFKRC